MSFMVCARRPISSSVPGSGTRRDRSAWELPSEHRRAVTAAHEQAVLRAGGVVIRYGQLWGPGTFYETAPPDPPRIHVDDAARQTVSALTAPPGLVVVIDDRAAAVPR